MANSRPRLEATAAGEASGSTCSVAICPALPNDAGGGIRCGSSSVTGSPARRQRKGTGPPDQAPPDHQGPRKIDHADFTSMH